MLSMNKKELKNKVNENGFYLNFVADRLTHTDAVKKASSVKAEDIMFDSHEDIPEWENIVVMSWILSQNYPVWKKSRNWYKINQKGVDYSDYKYNNIVLLQHNDSLGWIGRARMIYLDSKWNSNIIMYVDLNTISDEATRYQIKEWYIKWVSTWHELVESKFEDVNDWWKLITSEEAAEKYWYDEAWYAYFGMSDKLIYVVTKASMIENSVVTIGSNEKAILSHDTIGNCAMRDAMDKDMLKHLLSNKDRMNKDKLIELIENSSLTRKDKAEMSKLLNDFEINEADEPAVVEGATEEVKEEVSEEVVAEPTEEVKEETNDVDVVTTEGAEIAETPSEEVVEEKAEVTEEVEDKIGEGVDDEGWEPAPEAAWEEVAEEPKEEPENVEANEKVEEEEAPAEEPKEETVSDEKLAAEIESLKNELSEMKTLVNSLVKDKEEMVEVISELWELSLKNSKNLSNIVALWVSEVSNGLEKKDSLSKLRNALKKSLN